jgi:hypothetical protein
MPLDPDEERPEPVRLRDAAIEFGITREEMRKKLLRDGAVATPDGRWRIRDVIAAMAGPRLAIDFRISVERMRAVEKFAAELSDLSEQVRALPGRPKDRRRRDALADDIAKLTDG